MRHKYPPFLGGCLIAIAILGVYSAMAQSASHPEATTVGTEATAALPTDAALLTPQQSNVCSAEDDGSPSRGMTPVANCGHCATTTECINLQCCPGGDSICVQHRCLCF